MPWSARFLPEFGVVEMTYADLVSPDELLDSVQATIALGTQHQVLRCLADCRQMRGGHNTFDIHQLVRSVRERFPTFREAILVPVAALEGGDTVAFFQKAATNRGAEVRLFSNRDAALKWLTAPGPPHADR